MAGDYDIDYSTITQQAWKRGWQDALMMLEKILSEYDFHTYWDQAYVMEEIAYLYRHIEEKQNEE